MNNIRRASLDEVDIKAIQQLSNFFYFLYRQSVIDYILKKSIYVCERDEGIIGMLLFSHNEKTHEYKILNLVVEKKLWGQGIGREFFNFFIKDRRPIKIKILATYSPDSTSGKYNSVGFWEKLGFKITGEPKKIKLNNYLMPMYWVDERLR